MSATKVKAQQKHELKEPSMFLVVLLNDDFTPMDFVVAILEEVFHHPVPMASRIMMDIHTRGKGVAGRYTAEIAETKAATVVALAKKHGHPLQTVVERE